MRLAVLADIHGNLPALEAVIAELERLQPDLVILNGDLINAVPFSGPVIDRVRALDWVVIRGNHEFYYLDYGTDRALPGSDDPKRWGQLHWLVQRITPEQGAYLAVLPDDRTLYLPGTQPIRVTHGVPGRNRVGFYPQQSDEKILSQVRSLPQRTLVSAHTHLQVDRHVYLDPELVMDPLTDPHVGGRTTPDISPETCSVNHHWHVINPGSVGLPLGGDPRAQFAILEAVPEEVEPGGWRATMHRVAYDRRPALEAYETSGMLEAGHVISEMFRWELITAEPEIIYFYQWANRHGYDPDSQLDASFQAYVAATGRDAYVRERDPLRKRAGQP